MKIILTTLGSRGDVQPYLALAVGLKNAGHHPTLAAPATFADWIRAYDVETVPLSFNPQEAMKTLSKGKGLRMRTLLTILRDGMKEVQDEVWQAAQDTDFFIQSGTGMGVMEIAATRGIPGAFAYLFPFAPTRAFPMFWLPFRKSLGGTYNLLTYKAMSRMLWQFGGAMNNDWRKRLGLKPWRTEADLFAYAHSLNTPYLYGYSPSLLPKPTDWDTLQHVTGSWYLDEPNNFQPPSEVLRFLENGPPPIYIGFGSMNAENPERQTQIALKALELTGQRGLLLTEWGAIAEQPPTPNTLFIHNIPHSWLFPRVAAVVHHGGAGTTAAGLRAGIPSILTPFGGDQFSFADLVIQVGVGPKTPGIKNLTAEKLAASINQAINHATMRANAAALSEKIRAENGIARAVEVIEKHAATHHHIEKNKRS